VPILTATNLEHHYGDWKILDGISLTIEPTDRIGIVGRNGAGKTTLMRALTGELKVDQGQIALQRGARVGYLTQDHHFAKDATLFQAAESAFAELAATHEELNQIYHDMGEAQGDALDTLMKRQVEVENRMHLLGGYAVEHKIEATLHGLGFTDAQFTIPVSRLSGGQKGRLALARLLLEQPDILLLDEPTNHLDIEGRMWLEEFLAHEYQGAVVMISHDRYLLDAVVTRIIEVESGRLIDYPGNYADFRRLREERLMVQNRAYEAQQDKFKREEAFIRKYKAGQRARQAKGRETRLDREKDQKTIERPMEMAVARFNLPKPPRSSEIVASVRGLSKSYTREDGTTKILFHDLDVVINRGERWGIIGPNGAGKTTLVNCLLGTLPADVGTVRLGANLAIGYYRQTHEGLTPELPVYRYLQNVILKEAPQAAMSEQAARNLAGSFLFSGEDQEKLLGQMSGGERTRAVLAGLLASAKNLLILDEPTNHLDIPSSERLEDVLSAGDEENPNPDAFEGTMILISHDRALLDATCDHLIVLDGDGNAEIFLGGFSLWHEKSIQRKREADRKAAEEKSRREDNQRRQDEAAKKREAERAPSPSVNKNNAPKPNPSKGGGSAKGAMTVNAIMRLTTDQLEDRIEKVETRMREIDALLNDPDVWRDHARATKLGDERAQLAEQLEPLEFEWARRAEDNP
jgi:ATP-binding cassette subfamily F protein 3